ncbi:leukocyte receptor cluster member 1 [Capsicum galapagoense]
MNFQFQKIRSVNSPKFISAMGGHGGLNILPQKRWNVYNFDNREKVKRDEEAAAKEEQLKQEQSRKRDSQYRLEQLRQARRGSASSSSAPDPSASPKEPPEKSAGKKESDSKHINLFEGIRIFDPVKDGREKKRAKKEEAVRVIAPEDEKYRLGYGIVGKGTKLPWYMEKRKNDDDEKSEEDNGDDSRSVKKSNNGKKTVEELRKERLERERKEKGRERALLMEKSRRDGGFSRRI